MKTYKEAIKPPREGYKYSTEIQQTAQLAEMIAAKHCIRAKVIFDWSMKHNIKLLDFMPELMDSNNLLKANTALLEDIFKDAFTAIKNL